MTTIRVTTSTTGEDTGVQTMPSTGHTYSSTDYDAGGVTVRTGLHARTVQDQSQIADTDMITIDGMELSAKMARELGLMGRVFDESLSVGAAAKAKTAPKATEAATTTGHADYDAAVENLNAHLEDGSMTYEEATVYETALGEVALQGLSVEHLIETVDGLANGTVDATAVPGDVKSMIASVEAKITQSATMAAKAELGDQGFASLQALAAQHPGVARVARQYAIDRAQGKHQGITWAELAADLREQIGR